MSPEELDVAQAAEEHAELLAELEPELILGLPRQLVHGDFWDNNVGFRDSSPVSVADFDLMGVRPRIDDPSAVVVDRWVGSEAGRRGRGPHQ